MRTPFPFLAALLAGTLLAQGPLRDPRPRLPGGLGPAGPCAAVDLDGDGDVDLLRVEGMQLRVLLQTPHGTFESAPNAGGLTFPGGGEIVDLAVGQFDGDPWPEVVVGRSGGADVFVDNLGQGRLIVPANDPIPPTPFVATRALVAGDFHPGGPDDLLVLVANAPARLLRALPGPAAAFVDVSGSLPSTAVTGRSTGAAGDFDLDSNVDILLGSTALASALVLLNDGQGNFAGTPLRVPTGTVAARRILAADVTGDRRPDVVWVPETAPARFVVVHENQGATFPTVAPDPGGFAVDGFRDLAVADLDGDGVRDVLAIDGAGGVQFGAGTGSGRFAAASALLRPGPRARILVADLEPDSDLDLWLPGAGVEDALLLASGAVPRFVPTEDRTAPVGTVEGERAVVLVDVTGDGDLDVVQLATDGRAETWANDGAARFTVTDDPFPPLPPSRYGAVVRDRLSNAVIARDLFVLGQPSQQNPSGVRLLRWSGGRFTDTGLFPDQRGRILTAIAARPMRPGAGAHAIADVLLGDGAGLVTLHRYSPTPTPGFRPIANAVTVTGAGAVRQLLIADLDRDGSDDLVVVHSGGPPEVHLGGSTTLRWRPGAAGITWTAVAGALGDVDGDRVPDLVLATPGRASDVTLLLGNGDGTFHDATARLLGAIALPGGFRHAAVLADARGSIVVLGRQGGADLVLHRRNAGLALVGSLPVSGSRATSGFAAADLDGDGDSDLVVARADARPAVLLGHDLQLAQHGVGQPGRTTRLRFDGPPGATAFLLFSPLTTRSTLPGIGVLRLVSPASLVGFPLAATGEAMLDLSVPPGLGPLVLPFQIALLEPHGVRLGNLELAVLGTF